MEYSVVKLGIKDSIKHSKLVLPLIMLFEVLLIANWFLNTDDKTSIGSLGYLYCYVSLLVVTLFAYVFQRLACRNLDRHYKKLSILHYSYVMFIMVWCTVFTYIGSEYHNNFDYLLFVTIVTLAPTINYMRPAFWITLQMSCTAAVYLMASHHPHFFSFAVNFSVFTIISVIAGWFVYKVRRSGYVRMIALDNAANHDALTDMPNRQSYNSVFNLLKTKGLDQDLAVIAFDINDLKSVNDEMGHEVGDEMITGTADCLKQAFQKMGTVYHMGSDKFLAILHCNETQLQQCISNFGQLTAERNGTLVDAVSVSLGCVTAKEHPDLSLDELATLADNRMYVAKRQYYMERILGIAKVGDKFSDKEIKWKKLEFLNRVGNALLRDYQSMFLVDLHTGMASPIKVENSQNAFKMGLPESFEYQTFIDGYTKLFDAELFDGENKTDLEIVRQHFSHSTEPISIRYRAHRNAAGQEYFEIIIALIDDDNRYVVLAVKGIDAIVNEVHQQKKALEAAMERAEIANKAKSIFLFNMSHDIRTPMNAILGFTNMMENELDDITKLKDHLHKVKNSGEFLLALINNVLDMARIESGNAKLEEQVFDFTDPDNNSTSLFEEQMAAKHITCKQSIDVKHTTLMADKMKIDQITMNIISNAVKYTPDGGTIEISLTEVPSEREGYGKFVFRCKDTGIGMTKEFAEHLFEMFSRERNTTTSGVMGVGLGMAIVKKLVELMGGTIEVETEPGKGTTFTVTHWHKIVEKSEPRMAEKQINEDITLKGKRMLVAEDNDLNAEIVMAILEDMGIEAERAADGEECVKMLCDAEPDYYDVILMDIQMPRLNGYDATRRIRSLDDAAKSNISIVAVTANAFEEDKREAFRSGMNGHLAKPINVQSLKKELTRVMERSTPEI